MCLLRIGKTPFLLNAIILSSGTIIAIVLFSLFFYPSTNPVLALFSSFRVQISEGFSTANNQGLQLPKIYDINLKADIVFGGLNFPSSMAFLGSNDLLVLEKNKGTVQRIINGEMVPKPLLNVSVSNQSERGMLGIGVYKNESKAGRVNIFLYFTQSIAEDNETLSNSLYKYELVENKLVNPKKLLDLPSSPGPAHNGGRITIGPDNNVYFTVGNLNAIERERYLTRAENVEKGRDPDGRAGILRVTQDGQPLPNGSLIGDKYPLVLYYAYGIRNSFGMDFDPLTGKLWDTENGPNFGDEINLVDPGFNSGWNKVQGIWEEDNGRAGPIINKKQERERLVDFNGQGKYSNPEFIWASSVGPTALTFLDSEIYGKEYENDLFVGDFHNGNIYHFDLTENRTALELDGFLEDKIADSRDELKNNLFGQGFGGITDIGVGPDGYLYILSIYQSGNDCIANELGELPCISYSSPLQGTIFRVVP